MYLQKNECQILKEMLIKFKLLNQLIFEKKKDGTFRYVNGVKPTVGLLRKYNYVKDRLDPFYDRIKEGLDSGYTLEGSFEIFKEYYTSTDETVVEINMGFLHLYNEMMFEAWMTWRGEVKNPSQFKKLYVEEPTIS